MSMTVTTGSRLAAATLSLAVVAASVPHAARASLGAEVEALTGAHTKVVWVRGHDGHASAYPDASSVHWELWGFDSHDDAPHQVLAGPRGLSSPMITSDGGYVVFGAGPGAGTTATSTWYDYRVWMVPFDGSSAPVEVVLPATGSHAKVFVCLSGDGTHDWIYTVNIIGNTAWQPGVWRFRLDDPASHNQLVWNVPSGDDWVGVCNGDRGFGVSRDQTTFGTDLHVPGEPRRGARCTFGSTASNGTWVVPSDKDSCNSNLSRGDGKHLIQYVTEDNHTKLAFTPGGSTTSHKVDLCGPLGQDPGAQQTWAIRWSSNDECFTMSAPMNGWSNADDFDVYLCEFDAAYTSFDHVRITHQAGVCDNMAYAWIDPGSSGDDEVTIDAFTATPPTISSGQTSTLAWLTTNATTVEIQPDVGPVAGSGNVDVTPAATTTYTLTAGGTGGPVTQTVVVTVSAAPRVDAFAASPAVVSPGGTATLSWETSNATSVAIDGGVGAVAVDGSVDVTPEATTTYTITALGAGGSDAAQVTVTVSGVELTSPTGAEVWYVGTTRYITWAATPSVTNVTLNYKDDASQWVDPVNAATLGLEGWSVTRDSPWWGAYPWLVPDEPNAACQVNVADYSGAGQSDRSGAFEIRAVSSADGDAMDDAWESAHFGGTSRDGTLDADGDGLSDLQEFLNGTNPNATDTDGDLNPDAWEVAHFTDPTAADATADYDGDGADNRAEYLAGTDPRVAEVDGAGTTEVAIGCAPRNAGGAAGAVALAVWALAAWACVPRRRPASAGAMISTFSRTSSPPR